MTVLVLLQHVLFVQGIKGQKIPVNKTINYAASNFIDMYSFAMPTINVQIITQVEIYTGYVYNLNIYQYFFLSR